MNNQALIFESVANSGIVVTLTVGGKNRQVAIALSGDDDVSSNSLTLGSVEELVNDMFNCPDFLNCALQFYPDTLYKLSDCLNQNS